MTRLHHRLPSPAMIVACTALVLALTGVGYAAAVLPSNSVGTQQIRKAAVSASKLQKGAVTPAALHRKTLEALKSAPGSPGAKGEAGPQGPQGPQGPKGDAGAPAQLAAGSVTPAHLAKVPTVRVFSDTMTPVPNAQMTQIPFEAEEHDAHGMHDPAKPERLRAPIAGVYSINAQLAFSPAVGGVRVLRVVKPGIDIAMGTAPSVGASVATVVDAATQIRLDAGEEVGVQAFQNSGMPLTLSPLNTEPYTAIHLAMTWIAP